MAELTRELVQPLTDADQARFERAAELVEQTEEAFDDVATRGGVRRVREKLRAALEQLDGIDSEGCPRCSECTGQGHHWLTTEVILRVPCKHCPATTALCAMCGEVPVDSDDAVCGECEEES